MKSANFLDKLLMQKQQEVDLLIENVSDNPKHILNAILKESRRCSMHFSNAIKGPDLTIIGEVKRRSPSLGEIRHIEDPAELALKYCLGGASAISVLTEAKGFGGSLEDLKNVATTLTKAYPQVAMLRKDFIIHPLQLAEAVHAGAHAVLIIGHAVGKKLKNLLKEAKRLGLEVLTEVHDMDGLELALEAEAPIIGINHRNLKTFEVDITTSEKLLPFIPSNVLTVAESGIHDPVQAKRMRELGYDAILVGEALVRSKDPSQLIKQMKGNEHES